MAAEITLFSRVGVGPTLSEQVAAKPINSYTASFTSPSNGVIRVYANGAAVVLTINSITWTIPANTVEYFGVLASQAVTVA